MAKAGAGTLLPWQGLLGLCDDIDRKAGTAVPGFTTGNFQGPPTVQFRRCRRREQVLASGLSGRASVDVGRRAELGESRHLKFYEFGGDAVIRHEPPCTLYHGWIRLVEPCKQTGVKSLPRSSPRRRPARSRARTRLLSRASVR